MGYCTRCGDLNTATRCKRCNGPVMGKRAKHSPLWIFLKFSRVLRLTFSAHPFCLFIFQLVRFIVPVKGLPPTTWIAGSPGTPHLFWIVAQQHGKQSRKNSI